MKTATRPNHSLREIPSGVWALGLVSMLMDVSSEMIRALLPVCPVTVLSTSIVTVAAIKGIAEATGSTTKIFSRMLWDVAGLEGAFFAGACLAFLALVGRLGMRGQQDKWSLNDREPIP
jgi:hypothetical protein